MAVLRAYPTSISPQAKKFASIIAGGSVLAYVLMLGIREDFKQNKSSVEDHRPLGQHPYTSTDALAVVHHPAKNANMKGSMPTASKWV